MALSSYALGTTIFYLIGPIFGVGYAVLCILSLLAGLRLRCCYCYYYGKRCPSGLGILGKLLFKKGDPWGFKEPKNLIPAGVLDFGVLLLPILGGIVLCAVRFSIFVAALLTAYILIAGIGGFTVKKMFCRHCEQGHIGCPAYEGMKGKGSK